MTWIDDRLEQLKEVREHNRIIVAGAEAIFDDLWKEIAGLAKESNAKGHRVGTNGSANERIVFVPIPSGGLKGRRELRIRLDKHLREISAEGNDVSLVLSIDICDAGVICLKDNGRGRLIQ